MKIENDYAMLPTTDGKFVLTIGAHEKPAENPYIVYANGKHAVLFRNKDKNDAVVLDFLPPDAQKLMSENKRAIVIELKDGKPNNDYIAEIQICDKLPVQLTES